jgi:hypothetical protein
MNTFERIQNIAKSLNIPAYPDSYTGKDSARPERWITYNFAANNGDLYGDDAPNAVVHSIQVHLFMPANKNFFAIQNSIRNALFEDGFTYPEITVLVDTITTANSGTSKLRHIVFECETEDEDFYENEED